VRDLVHFYPEVKVGYARLVTISTDNLLKTNEFRDGEGAQWLFLSDPARLGHHHTGNASCLGTRRARPILSLRQEIS